MSSFHGTERQANVEWLLGPAVSLGFQTILEWYSSNG